MSIQFDGKWRDAELKLSDNINPSHYKKYKLETIDNIQNSMTSAEFVGYIKGSIKKYLDRYQDKNGVEDLNKAKWFLNKLIEVTENDVRL